MKLRLSLSILLVLLVVTAGQPVLAVDTTLTPTTSTTNRVKERQEKIREEVKEAQERRLAQMDELKTRIATREAEIKKRVEERNERLEKKLQEFKDQRKAEITERVSDNLNKINKKRVEMMTLHLSKMEEILGKVKDRVAERSEGKDVSSITKAITDAQTAIDAAKSALVTQAGKDYTVTVSSESSVRTDVQTKRDLLHTDLKALHEKIVAARKATSNAIRTAYSTLGKGLVDAPEGTVTPTITSGSSTATPTQSVTVTVTNTPTMTPTTTPTNTVTPTVTP